MSIQYLTDAKTLSAAASALGAKLPKNVVAAIDHADASARPAPAQSPGHIAASLVAKHLGDPKGFEQAVAQASAAFAAEKARVEILNSNLGGAFGVQVRALMQREADVIAAAFGDALAGDLATLEEHAGNLPEGFTSDDAASLTAAQFEEWTRCREAWGRVVMAVKALDPIYPEGAPELGLRREGAAALRAVAPSTDRPHQLLDALNGFSRSHNPLGPSTDRAVFTPTAVAHNGSHFEWAGPSVAAERVAALLTALTPQTAKAGLRW